MNVIAAINGQVTAEVAALYGLHFARSNGLPLVLLHVANSNDSIEAVEKSIANIKEVAKQYDIPIESVFLEGPPAESVKRYLIENKSEILFCATRYRQRKKFFNRKDCDAD